MADAALKARSPLEGLALAPARASPCRKRRRPRASSCAGAEAVRVACGMAFGAEPPSQLGAASEAGGRAALWLGPDEWLLIADGADAPNIGETLESVLEGTAHSLVDVSHRQIGLVASGPAAARVLNAGCPLDLEPRRVSGRLRDAHIVRQSGDRALAPRRGDLPCRGLAFVCALARRLARRGRARRAGVVKPTERGRHEP